MIEVEVTPMVYVEVDRSIDTTQHAQRALATLGEDNMRLVIKKYREVSLSDVIDALAIFAPVVANARVETFLPVLFEKQVKDIHHEKRVQNGGNPPEKFHRFDKETLADILPLSTDSVDTGF